jgi:hypothetical protein
MVKPGTLIVAAWLALSAVSAQAREKSIDASKCLETRVQASEQLANVFSRTQAFEVQGFEPLVRRVSGTGFYEVERVTPQEIVTRSAFLYDGRAATTGETTIKDGGRTLCWKGDCSAATDASGVSINPRLWGTPRGKLHVGQSWEVTITMPWELGPPGRETVRVVSVDPSNDSITLERRGEGEGETVNETRHLTLVKDQKAYLVDVSAGRATWSGRTTFRRGIILSDVLLVERPVTISSKELGQSIGVERQYILLNATQPDLLRG